MGNITWTKQFSATPSWFFITDPGASQLTDGQLLAGYARDAGAQTEVAWLESLDDGLTWAEISTTPASDDRQIQRLVHVAENILVWTYYDIVDNTVHVLRSANGGHSWTEVQSYHKDRPPSLALVCGAALSFERSAFAIAGRFNTPSGGGTLQEIATSLDAGETWTLGGVVDSSPGAGRPKTIRNGGSGTWLCGIEDKKIFKTTDWGATWYDVSPTTFPAGFLFAEMNAIAFVTPDIVLAGGMGNATGDHWFPYLYRSTDRGETWTHIPAASIEDWPTANGNPQIFEIQRLTRDGAIFTWGPTGLQSTTPWRLSTDQGQTWRVTNTPADWNTDDSATGTGAVITTKDGSIISLLTVEKETETYAEIWRGTWEC